MSLVGKYAPNFSAPAVLEGKQIVDAFSLEAFRGKSEVLLFFYPKAFTPVCHSELLALQKRLSEFEAKKVALVGISGDTEDTLKAWLSLPEDQNGVKGVTFPMVADTAKTISHNYGVLGGDWDWDDEDEEENLHFVGGLPVPYRGTFLIDKAGVVRHELVNDLPIGRDVDEILRVVSALQHVEAHGTLCKVNWKP